MSLDHCISIVGKSLLTFLMTKIFCVLQISKTSISFYPTDIFRMLKEHFCVIYNMEDSCPKKYGIVFNSNENIYMLRLKQLRTVRNSFHSKLGISTLCGLIGLFRLEFYMNQSIFKIPLDLEIKEFRYLFYPFYKFWISLTNLN